MGADPPTRLQPVNAFTFAFILALGLNAALQLWLSGRQVRHVQANRTKVPEAFRERIPLHSHQRAADYTVDRTRLGMVEVAWSALVLFAWTLGGGLDLLGAAWEHAALTPLWGGAALVMSVIVVSGFLELPLDIWRTFVIEQRHGYNRTRPSVFAADRMKQLLLFLVVGLPTAWVLLWLMRSTGQAWWVYAWAFWTGFGILALWVYPAFIAPLFNRFTPLADESLRRRLTALIERCGFHASGILVMDGSRRSSHGNAYFTGLGRHKRIVFFDTLLESLTPEQIEAVLAHELGHFKLRHIQKRLLSSTLISFGGFALLGWLASQSWFYAGLGVSRASDAMALILFLLVAPVFGFYFKPVFSHYSRKHEFEADEFASQQAAPEALVEALLKLYRENGSALSRDPIYSRVHDSHPPGPVRIARLASKMSG